MKRKKTLRMLALAAAMMLLVRVFATPLTRLLGATGNAADLLPRARAYLIGIAILPPFSTVRSFITPPL